MAQVHDRRVVTGTEHRWEISGRAQAIRMTMDIVNDEREVRLDLRRCLEAHLGLRLHAAGFQACVRRVVAKGIGYWRDDLQDLVLSAGSAVPAEVVARKLAVGLAKIAWQPLTPRMLLSALNITTQERLRWTKDGRLRPSGRIQIREGGVIYSVPTYPISLAEKLTASPEILSAWREQDAAG